MIIDKNGIINFQNLEVFISPAFTLDNLKNNPHFKDFTFNGSNGDYIRFGIQDVMIDGLLCYALLIFYKNKISQISITYNAIINKKPEERTKEQVGLTKKKHDEWLIDYYGDNRKKFFWGAIISALDNRHIYDASIAIIYYGPENEKFLSRIS